MRLKKTLGLINTPRLFCRRLEQLTTKHHNDFQITVMRRAKGSLNCRGVHLLATAKETENEELSYEERIKRVLTCSSWFAADSDSSWVCRSRCDCRDSSRALRTSSSRSIKACRTKGDYQRRGLANMLRQNFWMGGGAILTTIMTTTTIAAPLRGRSAS